MKLLDLSYIYNNMTSIEEIDVENYLHIKEFVDNFELEKGEIDLDFLGLPKMTIGVNNGHYTFAIGDQKAGVIILNESDREMLLNSPQIIRTNKQEEIKEFLEDIELPYVVIPTEFTKVEKEAVYHLFMSLKAMH